MQKNKEFLSNWLANITQQDKHPVDWQSMKLVDFYQGHFKRGEHFLTYTQNHEVNHMHFTTKEILRPNYAHFYLFIILGHCHPDVLIIVCVDYFYTSHSALVYSSWELRTVLGTLQGETTVVCLKPVLYGF